MGVEVSMPKKKQETSMGRRIVGMAAPIVGGIYGGPAGAAAGGVLGAKITGSSGQDAVMSGAESGMGQLTKAKSPAPGGLAAGPQPGDQMMLPAKNETPFSRKLQASQSNPQVAAAEGLDILSQLPSGHPLREQYTAPLIRMQMMGQRRTPVQGVG
jgi:hypothetical protein